MTSHDLTRSPTATTFATLSILTQLAAAYRLPRETKTIGRHELNVVSYPLVTPTPAPTSPHQLRLRDFNTVCGYIGGDPAFPATCLAGSHCVVEVEHGAVGCCPDGGACTEGIFTGCVDVNSPPQTVLDPYIFTCSGSQVCYKNDFDGGYYQYGCGTASRLATTVATSAFRHSGLSFSHVTVALTAKPKLLATPTIIGSRISTNDHSSSAKNTEAAEAADATGASQGSSASASIGATAMAGSATDPAAPEQEDPSRSSSGSLVGGIIGGVVGGISFLVLIVVFVVFWRKRHHQEQPNAYVTPDPEEEKRMKAQVLSSSTSSTSSPRHSTREAFQRPVQSLSSMSSKRSSPLGLGLTLPSRNSPDRPSDEIPLTDEKERAQAGTAPVIETETDPYPGPRRGGGGSFWSQTRSQPRSRDRSWA